MTAEPNLFFPSGRARGNRVMENPIKARQKRPEHGIPKHAREPSEADLWIQEVHHTER
jgi:hypothetical protein